MSTKWQEDRRRAQRHAKRIWRDNPERAQLLYGIGATRQPRFASDTTDLFSARSRPDRNSRNSDTEER
jgi:hypothetical protein